LFLANTPLPFHRPLEIVFIAIIASNVFEISLHVSMVDLWLTNGLKFRVNPPVAADRPRAHQNAGGRKKSAAGFLRRAEVEDRLFGFCDGGDATVPTHDFCYLSTERRERLNALPPPLHRPTSNHPRSNQSAHAGAAEANGKTERAGEMLVKTSSSSTAL
jgi:hypothetical protein